MNQRGEAISPIKKKEHVNKNLTTSSQDKLERKRNSKGKVMGSQSGHFRKKITSKNNREMAMESIMEEDEN